MKVVANNPDSSAVPNEEDPVEVNLNDVNLAPPLPPKKSSALSLLSQDQSCSDDFTPLSSERSLVRLPDNALAESSCHFTSSLNSVATSSADNDFEVPSDCSTTKEDDSSSAEDAAIDTHSCSNDSCPADCKEYEETYDDIDDTSDDEATPLDDGCHSPLSINMQNGSAKSDCLNLQRENAAEETYDNVEDIPHDENTPLNGNIGVKSSLDKESLLETVVVIDDGHHEAETSWKNVQEEHKERRAREAVAALNQNRPHEKPTPFRYKTWILQLSHRRRFEILIAVGLFLWLAFFIVLAIFMNGPASQSDDQDSTAGTDRNLVSGSKFKPIVNQSIWINVSSDFGIGHSLSPTIAATTLQPLKIITEVTAVTSQQIVDLASTSTLFSSSSSKHSHPPSTNKVTSPTTAQNLSVEKNSVLTSEVPVTLNSAVYLSTDTMMSSKGYNVSSAKQIVDLASTSTLFSSSSSKHPHPPSTNKVTSPTTAQNLFVGKNSVLTSEVPVILNSAVYLSTDTMMSSKRYNVSSSTHIETSPYFAKTEPESQTTVKPNSTASAPANMTSSTKGKVWLTEDTSFKTDAGLSDANRSDTNSPDTLKSNKLSIGIEPGYHPNQLVYTKQPLFDLHEVLKEMKPNYKIGLGRADITGPAADVNMMGYANPSQTVSGLHMRQYARSYLIAHGSTRVVFVNIDACMASTLVKLEVLKKLQPLYGDLYAAENLCISGTHTHSAPAGFLQDVLFQVTSMGYVPETLSAMVDGIVMSIQMAHNNLAPGYIMINKGELLDSNINRSPAAYLNNPEKERKKYKYDVDKEMVLLKFLDANGNGVGMLNWFAVHCTSMNNTNTLISGDNKGYAELLFEQEMNPGSLSGQGEFVAAFAQSNEGDVSPNTNGPHCVDTGLPCDNIHSTCNGKVQNCIATGPGKDMFESTKIIGSNQYEKAKELYKSASIFLTGPVQAVHQYIDMSNQNVVLNSTHNVTTCKPAMGFSFAAGTTDGPGAFNFKQGDKSGNAFWKIVRNFLHSPSQNQTDCHHPKPILLDTGEMGYPYSWQPDVVDTQVFRIGQLVLSAVPGEFSTMSGRRLRDAVVEVFAKSNLSEKFESVIAGLSNTYSDYITTYEEYHVQRYEGASTIFGPHTLSAYIQQYKKLATSLVEKETLSSDVEAENLLSKLMSFVPGVVYDTSGLSNNFGDVLRDVKDNYTTGESVEVQFVSGNPRNSPTVNMTFLSVERKTGNETWKVVKTDGDWDTKYIWERSSTLGNLRGLSEVTVVWDTSSRTPSGHYRINHYGHYKYWLSGKIYSYEGRSKEFHVFSGTSSE